MHFAICKVCPNRNWASQKAHQCWAALISGFCSMKRLGVFLLHPGWDTSPLQVTSQQFARLPPKESAGSQLYTWVERGTVRVKCFA